MVDMESAPGPQDPDDRLARRNGRLYLIGLATSLIGNSAMSLVAGIWVKSLTGSSAEAGLVSVCVYAPSLAGPVAGMVADRVRHRRWLLALNLMSAVLMLPLLAVSGHADVWIIFAVMAWYGTALTLEGPAESALFVEMLPAEMRQQLNGWNLGLQETGRLVAPLVGAGLFALVGGGSVALLDAATFGLAAIMIWQIHLNETKPTHGSTHWRSDVLAGVGYIRRTTDLRRLVVFGAVVIGVSGASVAAQYSLVSALGEPPSFLGVLSACLGAGSIVASLTSSRLLGRLGEGWVAVIGSANFGLGNLLRASGWLPAAIVGSVVLGFALPWVFLAVLNLAQRATPANLQGRVSAAVLLAVFGPQAPLQALGSAAIGYTSYQVIYVASAAVAMGSAGWLVASLLHQRRLRQISAQPLTPPGA